MSMMIALIAHDRKKEEMLGFVREYQRQLEEYQLVATATTGKMIREQTGLPVTSTLSGPMGGDLEIGAMIAQQKIAAVIFLRDPLTAQPHEPDITALLRVCDVHEVPVATNVQGARLLLAALRQTDGRE